MFKQAAPVQTQALMKQQHKLIAEERSAITKEERQNMERLLITISSSIHKDLPLLFEDTLRKEFSNASTRLSAAVRASVAESLPKEIVGTSFQVHILFPPSAIVSEPCMLLSPVTVWFSLDCLTSEGCFTARCYECVLRIRYSICMSGAGIQGPSLGPFVPTGAFSCEIYMCRAHLRRL